MFDSLLRVIFRALYSISLLKHLFLFWNLNISLDSVFLHFTVNYVIYAIFYIYLIDHCLNLKSTLVSTLV